MTYELLDVQGVLAVRFLIYGEFLLNFING
jgi:hypothetical protein